MKRLLRNTIFSSSNRKQRKQVLTSLPSCFSRRKFSTMAPSDGTKKTTILDLQKKYKDKLPLTMVTAYDYCSAYSVDSAGIDMILVGDSLGMVMLGYSNTTAVTMDDMIHHCKAVSRAAKRCFLVGDMPFGSYEVSPTDAVRNATRIIKEGQMEAVKMEGGRRIKDAVKAVVSAGIPVFGHIGLTPQTAAALGGFKVQGKNADAAKQLLEDAYELQAAGVSLFVIESVPEPVGTYITQQVSVPTIGIGAGPGTSGQVLVYHDMLGLYPNFVPKFCKRYVTLSDTIHTALQGFKKEVEERSFPAYEHSFTMKPEEFGRAFPEANYDNVAMFKKKDSSSQKQQMVNNLDSSKTQKQTELQTATAEPLEQKRAEQMILSKLQAETQSQPVQQQQQKTATVTQPQPTTSSQPSVSTAISSPSTSPSSTVPVKPKENKKRIVIIGGGSMGSLVGGRLAATNDYEVWMLSGWKEHVQKINRQGLILRNLDKSSQTVQLRAASEVDEILKEGGSADLAVVLVKSPHTKDAAEKAAKLIKPEEGLVLSLQNGLGNKELIESIVGESRVLQGVTNHGAFISESGIVVHTGEGSTTLAFDRKNLNTVKQIAEMLNRAGISCEMSEDFQGVVWGKLIINSAINPLSAILRVKNGFLASSAVCVDILDRTVTEGVTVANARGVVLPYKDPLDRVLTVATSTADNVSSMLSDVIRGSQTEIDSINGAIVREGDKLGVNVLLNKTLCNLVKLRTFAKEHELQNQLQ